MDENVSEGSEMGGVDRRSLIKKMGVAGAAAWTAPMLIDSVLSPAAAASDGNIPGPLGSTRAVRNLRITTAHPNSDTHTVTFNAPINANARILIFVTASYTGGDSSFTITPDAGFATVLTGLAGAGAYATSGLDRARLFVRHGRGDGNPGQITITADNSPAAVTMTNLIVHIVEVSQSTGVAPTIVQADAANNSNTLTLAPPPAGTPLPTHYEVGHLSEAFPGGSPDTTFTAPPGFLKLAQSTPDVPSGENYDLDAVTVWSTVAQSAAIIGQSTPPPPRRKVAVEIRFPPTP